MSKPKVRMWVAEPPPADVKAALHRLERLEDVARIAVMPDVHLGERVCIGCVIGTRRLIYPAAVGADIGCGIAAVPLDVDEGALINRGPTLLREIAESVPIIRQRSLAAATELEGELSPELLSNGELAATARRDGRVELGTLGRGNHFLEVQVAEDDRLWLMVHSGSRVMGQAITRLHLECAERGRGGLDWLDSGEDAGRAYLNDHAWAVRYAARSRRVMLEAVAAAAKRVFGAKADWDGLLDTHHNHVRAEEHSGEALLVHRKGANPAAAGEPGLIPGCMGGESFHVLGRGVEESLCSSSHGAGRAMSRTEARRRLRSADVSRDLQGVVFDQGLGDAVREESPRAYKDIRVVMRAQRELVRIVRVVRGLVTYRGR